MSEPASLSLQVVADQGDPLAAMLAHHRTLADEIVVVDTGGGQAALVAESVGARVVRRPWDDDFAAARNAGLEAATSQWILVLDADELIAPDDFARLRAAIHEPPAVRSMINVHYTTDALHPEWRPVSGRYPHQEEGQIGCFTVERGNLFPRRDGLYFVGRIGETIMPSAAALGLACQPLAVPVHHYGYAISADRTAQRKALLGRLVRLEYDSRPEDAGTVLAMAEVLLDEGDSAGAAGLLESLAGRTPVESATTRGRFLLGRLRRQAGDLVGASEGLAAAVRDDPRSVFSWIEWSRVRAEAGALDDCDRILADARRHLGDDPLLDREEIRHALKTRRVRVAGTVLSRLGRSHPVWQELQRLASRMTGKE